jgi:hypothetical protein
MRARGPLWLKGSCLCGEYALKMIDSITRPQRYLVWVNCQREGNEVRRGPWVQEVERQSCQGIECFTQQLLVQRLIAERRKRIGGLRSDRLCSEAHWIDSLFLFRASMLSRTLYHSKFSKFISFLVSTSGAGPTLIRTSSYAK